MARDVLEVEVQRRRAVALDKAAKLIALRRDKEAAEATLEERLQLTEVGPPPQILSFYALALHVLVALVVVVGTPYAQDLGSVLLIAPPSSPYVIHLSSLDQYSQDYQEKIMRSSRADCMSKVHHLCALPSASSCSKEQLPATEIQATATPVYC